MAHRTPSRALLCSALVLLAAAPASAQAVTLEVAREPGGWRLEVVNPTDADAHLLPGPPRLARMLVRFDVRQPGGRWIRADGLTAYDLEVGGGLTVPARGRLGLAPRPGSIPRFLRTPGRYRAVTFQRTADGVTPITTELRVTGWSRSHLEAAETLRARSEAAGCADLTGVIDRETMSRVDVAPLTDLYEHRMSTERRVAAAGWLLRRGSFVRVLERSLEHAPWAEARPLVLAASSTPRHLHRRVRRAAADRVARRLETTAPIDVATYRALERMWDGWTAPVLDAIALRLEAWTDRGDEEVALVELLVFGSVAAPRVEQRRGLLEALDLRCRGATADLARACRNARSRLAPVGCVIPAFHRAMAPPRSAARQPRPRPSASCRAVAQEWRRFTADAPGPEVAPSHRSPPPRNRRFARGD